MVVLKECTRACVIALVCAFAPPTFASEISGKIILQKRSLEPTVVSTVYDLRGVAVSRNPPAAKITNRYEQVAIWLESKTPAPAAPVKAVMRQRNRALDPGLLVIPVGSTVEFPNFDPIFHNIFSLSKTQSFDLGYYPEGRSRSVNFPRPGVIQIYCHIHPNMYGAIVVTESRWFGKPSADGSFSWRDVPPGSYRLCLWQKSAGIVHKKVDVATTAAAVQVEVSIPDEDAEN
jgi:plastocyanin